MIRGSLRNRSIRILKDGKIFITSLILLASEPDLSVLQACRRAAKMCQDTSKKSLKAIPKKKSFQTLTSAYGLKQETKHSFGVGVLEDQKEKERLMRSARSNLSLKTAKSSTAKTHWKNNDTPNYWSDRSAMWVLAIGRLLPESLLHQDFD